MRVLFVHSPADLYGASRSLLRLCAAMVEDHVEVGVIVETDGAAADHLRRIGCTVFIMPDIVRFERDRCTSLRDVMRSFASLVRDVVSQARLMAAWHPDIVHTNNGTIVASPIAAKLAGRPHLWHLRETFVEFPKSWRVHRLFMVTFSTLIVCNSQKTAEQFHGCFGERRVRVVYNGLPATEFKDLPPDRVVEWRHRLAASYGSVVGVVGRVKLVRKGQEVFLAAAQRMAVAFPDVRFVCIGGTYPGNESHLDHLRQMAANSALGERFHITGDIDEIGPATAALDIAVMPSVIPEPFGNVVMEAMSLGKPVIATNNGGAAEQVEHGITGFLVAPGDAAALADAIGRLLRDPALARRMGDAGRRRFEECFTTDSSYAAVRRLYDEILPEWRKKDPLLSPASPPDMA